MGVGLKKEHISEWVKLINGLLALIMKALNCMSHDELLKHVQEYRKYHPKDTHFDKKLLRHFDVENKNIYEFAMGKSENIITLIIEIAFQLDKCWFTFCFN